MRILVRKEEEVLADLSFEDEEITVGSQPNTTIHLPDEQVAGRHALIALDGTGNWVVHKLDPDWPIIVNRDNLEESRILENADSICIHIYELKIFLSHDLDRQVVEDTRVSTEELARIKQFPLPQGSVVKRHFDPLHMPKEELERIARIAVDLAGCRDMHELLDAALSMLLDAFNARMAWIGIRRKPEGELDVVGGREPTGQAAPANELIELLQYRCLERAQHICVRKVRDVNQVGSALAVPLTTPAGVLGLAYVDRPPRTRRFQIPDLDLLSALSCHVAAKLDAIVAERIHRSAQVSSTEVSVVHAIQAQLDPRSSPSWKHIQLAAYSRSGQEHPGDVYDIMEHPDTGMSAIMLGHVNATGASLALAMARLHSVFRVGYLHTDPPHALARALNWLVYNEKDPSTVDALFLVLEPNSGRFRFTRCGRIGGFIVNARGEPRRVEGPDGPSVGRIPNYEYISKVEQLLPGETMALYTRGVASATNAEGERFTEKRFIESVCDGFGQPPSATIQDLSYELTTFFADGKHADDITIIMLHRTE